MEKPVLGNIEGSVLFVDIENFLSISELLTPRNLRIFVQKAIKPISQCIINNGGYICQVQGDAILAIFTKSKYQKSHACLAVDCALKVQSILEKLNPIKIHDLLIPLGVNIGICSGKMYSCHIRAGGYKEFTVLGKTVNLASRYQRLNKHYGTNILIDDTVFAYIKQHIATRKLDKVDIDGCSESIRLYEVLFFDRKLDWKSKRREYFNERGLIAYLRNEWNIAIEYFRRGSKDNMNESGPSLAKAFETVKDDLNNN